VGAEDLGGRDRLGLITGLRAWVVGTGWDYRAEDLADGDRVELEID
jgi:hypothetical protein